MTSIRTNKFWESIPNFIKKDVHIPDLGIHLIGYFPYHTAAIKMDVACKSPFVPRMFFHEFEIQLTVMGIADNKAVYICKPDERGMHVDSFAIMLKDDWAVITTWDNVINYSGKLLFENKKLQEAFKNTISPLKSWSCKDCESPTPDYCLNICPIKREEDNENK